MKKLIVISIVLVFLGVLILVNSYTNAQQPRRAQPGAARFNPALMIRRSMGLEESWAQISFALNVNDEQLIEARKAYQVVWNDSKRLVKKITDREIEFRDARPKIREIRKNLNTKIGEILTEEQNAKFRDWLKEFNRRQQRPRQRGERQRPRQREEGGQPR